MATPTNTSGGKQLIINTGERAVSTDIFRLQSFADAGLAETLRYLLDVECGTDDVQAAGTQTETTGTTSPLTAEVVNGLCVQPQLASLNLLVTPGVLLCVNPDAVPSADDSPYKYVRDAGVPAPGTLAMPANPGVSAVISVVECSRQTTIVEYDVRDIFNASTGLFTATNVPKVMASSLQYRVRSGTAGGGWPGTASGWLPLMVASAPSGSTSCDQMTFWDVRPLVADREFQSNVQLAMPRRLRGILNGATSTAWNGIGEIVGTDGRRAGGQLNAVGSTGSAFDATNAANQDPSVAGSSVGTILTLALCFPFGLPRWACYTPSSHGSRVPQNPRGIPVLTACGFTQLGLPDPSSINFPVTLPSALGFGAAGVTEAVALFHTAYKFASPHIGEVVGSDEGGYYCASTSEGSASVAGSTVSATLTAGVHFPANATAIYVSLGFNYNLGSIESASVVGKISAPNDPSLIAWTDETPTTLVGAGSGEVWGANLWLPVPTDYPSDTGPSYLVEGVLGGTTLNSGSIQVVGWRY